MYTNCIINLPNISNFLILIREKYTIHEDEESSNKYSSNNLNIRTTSIGEQLSIRNIQNIFRLFNTQTFKGSKSYLFLRLSRIESFKVLRIQNYLDIALNPFRFLLFSFNWNLLSFPPPQKLFTRLSRILRFS